MRSTADLRNIEIHRESHVFALDISKVLEKVLQEAILNKLPFNDTLTFILEVFPSKHTITLVVDGHNSRFHFVNVDVSQS